MGQGETANVDDLQSVRDVVSSPRRLRGSVMRPRLVVFVPFGLLLALTSPLADTGAQVLAASKSTPKSAPKSTLKSSSGKTTPAKTPAKASGTSAGAASTGGQGGAGGPTLDAATVAAARGEVSVRVRASGEPYRFGFLLARKTGDTAVTHAVDELARGADLAVAFVNELGGIGGRPVSLVVAEEGATSESAVRGFDSLTERNVHAVIGPTLSKHARSVSVHAERSNTLLFGASTSANGIPAIGPWVRRSAISPDVMARGIAAELVAMRLTSTAVIAFASDDPVGRSVAASYSRAFADAGVAVLTPESNLGLGQSDFDTYAGQVGSLSPDVVVLAGSPSSTPKIVASLRQATPRSTIVIDPTSLTAQFANACVPCAGVLTPVLFDPEDVSSYSRVLLLRRYYDAYGTAPTMAAAQGFAAVQILAISLDAAVARQPNASVSVRRNLLREEVGVGRFDTPFGLVRFNDGGELVIERVALGEFVRGPEGVHVRGLAAGSNSAPSEARAGG